MYAVSNRSTGLQCFFLISGSPAPSSMARAPSRFPRDGGALDLLDKEVSRPVFKLQLGIVLECVLSVPGCFFGMPAFHVVAPSLIAGALGGWRDASALSLGTLAVSALLLVLFWLVNAAGSSSALKRVKLLYLPPALLGSPIFGMYLAHTVAAADAPARAAAAFYLLAWNVSIIPIITIKALAGRRRPVNCDPNHIGEDAVAAAQKKSLANICDLLRADGNAAFPSGDLAGSVAFAYPLWRACAASAVLSQPVLQILAVLCVGLSAMGRMYWQAHHLLDVTCGALVSFITCVLLDGSLGSFVCKELISDDRRRGVSTSTISCTATTEWWHPFAALVILCVYAKVSGTQNATPSRGARLTGK